MAHASASRRAASYAACCSDAEGAVSVGAEALISRWKRSSWWAARRSPDAARAASRVYSARAAVMAESLSTGPLGAAIDGLDVL